MDRGAWIATAGMALLCARAAGAAGAGIPDLGAASLGQAGATVARPADLTAVYYNPAALADFDGVHLYLDVRAIDHRIGYQRLDAAGNDPAGWAPVENQGGLAVAPVVVASYRLGPVTLAAGGHPQNGETGQRFPDPATVQGSIARGAPQRYLGVASNSKIYIPVFAAALNLASWISAGATLQLPIASFDARQAIYAGPVSGEFSEFDALLDLHATEAVARSGVLGISLRPLPWLAAGASLQLQTNYRARGTISATLPPLAQSLGLQLQGNRIAIDLTYPWVARAGVRVYGDRWSAELAGTFERWSLLQQITITPIDVQVQIAGKSSPLAPIVLQKNLRDAGSLRLGGELSLLRWLTLRAGVLAESSAIPEERQALDWVHWQRLSLNLGLGARWGRFDAALGFARFLQPDRQVRDSQDHQLAALPGVVPTVVGNGDFSSRLTLVAASIATEL
jgi:long-chain fatty acid transport protein